MKCPHCREGIHAGFSTQPMVSVGDSKWALMNMACPECHQPIMQVSRMTNVNNHKIEYPAFPDKVSSRPVPPEVQDPYKQDFNEACAVLTLSPKASAALSRRNLQALLKDKAGTTKKDLFDQIEEVIASGKLPSHIADSLHAVRNIGNFAAHEIKSKATGTIVDVEAGEAEWNLDVIEALFDFYFVEPAKTAKRKADLNVKLKAAGKPEIP